MDSMKARVADVDIVIEWGAFESVADVEAERLTNERVFPVCCPKDCPNSSLANATLVHRYNFPNRYDFPDWPCLPRICPDSSRLKDWIPTPA